MDIQFTETPALIGLDWGTSSLRAYLFDATGGVLDSRHSASGIMHLPKPRESGGFDEVFESLCGDWLNAHAVPVIAAGMVGSAQGWAEAPYVAAPANCGPLIGALKTVCSSRGAAIHIVPGIIEHGAFPNVMRGEETQIFGALAAQPELGAGGKTLIGLPGTHAKWAFVVDGHIERFLTFMTGEVFAVLRDYTILGRTMHPCAGSDDEAFLRGVDMAVHCGATGVLSTIFSTRTLGLTGELRPEQQSDYLSGLLIGHELAGLSNHLAGEDSTLDDWKLGLIGGADLCERYRTALARIGAAEARILHGTTEHGLFHIARDAGLLPAIARAH
ncbi:2-dehydro-3-deoxygalactonokinase [Paraburkholderia tropica]|uniref:2-dehydro-3-deoxygalactonokinase n=1 Tax=Paraburkholderia tropica TaxID=92647 RepID=UPI001CB17CF4|nr:2-dehydro-3-deoxygalactonokinase [Paraburkholderia tropica]CAG9222511.1 2-dehydro-3-deoxygalactonokinase [Paraburkholderia tropica]